MPIDHERPAAGQFQLACEWGATPRAGLPNILVVADAQQYYVSPGGAARLQASLFGSGFNLLAIVGRSRSAELARLVMKPDSVDWGLAYRLLNWRQWTGDILAVIRHFRLGHGGLCLYGRSGGAHLIHQLLAIRPDLQARVYIQAAVNHALDVQWGLGADHLWEEFSGREPETARALLDLLTRYPARRRDLILILQRQHFFTSLEELPVARHSVVRAFLEGDEAAIAALRVRYQIDAIEQSRGSLEGVGSAARVYEFSAPHVDPRGKPGPLRPDVEALFYYGAPFAEPGRRPPVPAVDWTRLRGQSAEVLQLTARWDHTCDYRTQIGLHGLTKGSRLLLLDDDHVFKRWTAAGSQPDLLRSFFLHGGEAPEFESALTALAPLRWSEAG